EAAAALPRAGHVPVPRHHRRHLRVVVHVDRLTLQHAHRAHRRPGHDGHGRVVRARLLRAPLCFPPPSLVVALSLLSNYRPHQHHQPRHHVPHLCKRSFLQTTNSVFSYFTATLHRPGAADIERPPPAAHPSRRGFTRSPPSRNLTVTWSS